MSALPSVIREISRLEAYLDGAVEEVFSTMMSVKCVPASEGGEPRSEEGTISAVVGLAGAISGSLVLHSGSDAAMRMAERMMGAAPSGVDGMVRDAIGEVCNMVAGAWKGADAELASGCLLSTPTVVAGTSYELFSQRAPIRIERSYRFEDLRVTVTIFCECAA